MVTPPRKEPVIPIPRVNVEPTTMAWVTYEERGKPVRQLALVSASEVFLVDGKNFGLSVTSQRSGRVVSAMRDAIFAAMKPPEKGIPEKPAKKGKKNGV